MTEHQKLLNDLLKCDNGHAVAETVAALEAHEGTRGFHAELDIEDIISVLERYLDHALTADDVAAWADAVSSREDIDFAIDHDDGAMLDILDELANPLIEGVLTPFKARQLLEEISE